MASKEKSQIKNPLIQAFGLLLKKARKKEQKSSDQMAEAIGISGSMFRLIEAGSQMLQPNKALDLIKALPNTQIEFHQLSLLLVALQVVENWSSNLELSQQAISELAAVDKGFGMAIKPLEAAWPDLIAESDSQKIVRKIDELAIPERLLEFLARKSDPATEQVTSSAAKWGQNLVAGTPPIYLDMVETMVTELKRFPPKVTPHEIVGWEKRYVGRFRRIYSVVETVQIITDTYSEFDWSWIFEDHFEGLPIISLSPPNQKRREQKSFHDLLEMLDKETLLKRKGGKSADKICKLRFAYEQSSYQDKFRLLLSEDSQARASLLQNINQLDQQSIPDRQLRLKFKNAWIYEIIPKTFPFSGDSYHIAFMDNRGIGQDSGYEIPNCTWTETECWVGLLESFWRGEP